MEDIFHGEAGSIPVKHLENAENGSLATAVLSAAPGRAVPGRLVRVERRTAKGLIVIVVETVEQAGF
jgi:hypothetical protein